MTGQYFKAADQNNQRFDEKASVESYGILVGMQEATAQKPRRTANGPSALVM